MLPEVTVDDALGCALVDVRMGELEDVRQALEHGPQLTPLQIAQMCTQSEITPQPQKRITRLGDIRIAG